jgi:hypothetical protein
MWGIANAIWLQLIPFNSCISISGFGGSHFEFRWQATSGSVDSVISESTMAEIMEVDV